MKIKNSNNHLYCANDALDMWTLFVSHYTLKWPHMGFMAFQITDNPTVYLTACTGYRQREYESSVLPALWKGGPLVTGGFHLQRAGHAKSVSISCHSHVCRHMCSFMQRNVSVPFLWTGAIHQAIGFFQVITDPEVIQLLLTTGFKESADAAHCILDHSVKKEWHQVDV